MNRDIIIALIIGLIGGSLIAITAVNLPNIIKSNMTPKVANSSITPTIIPKTPQIINLEVTSPQDQSLSPDKTIEIKGKTRAGIAVLLESNVDSEVKTASTDGNFSQKLDLAEGVNNIQITAIDETGEYSAKVLTVYYTGESL